MTTSGDPVRAGWTGIPTATPPYDKRTQVDPVPLKEIGRMVHETAAVDPRTGIVYLTEDRSNAGLYRFVPNQPGKLAQGGRPRCSR